MASLATIMQSWPLTRPTPDETENVTVFHSFSFRELLDSTRDLCLGAVIELPHLICNFTENCRLYSHTWPVIIPPAGTSSFPYRLYPASWDSSAKNNSNYYQDFLERVLAIGQYDFVPAKDQSNQESSFDTLFTLLVFPNKIKFSVAESTLFGAGAGPKLKLWLFRRGSVVFPDLFGI